MAPKKQITKNDIKRKPEAEQKKQQDSDTESNSEKSTENIKEINEKIDYDKYPLCFRIVESDGKIFRTTHDVTFSANIDFPRFEYGFHHFIHQGKNYFGDFVKAFEGKKQVWRVLNKYEVNVDNYKESISDVTKTYFDLNTQQEILSRAFYKLWEILMSFNLIDPNNDKFVSAHLAEGPGSFIQATIFWRDMFCKKNASKNDKYHAITLHPEGKSYVPEIDKKFIAHYEKESPKRFIMHKTYTKQEAGGDPTKDNGDLTDPKTLKLFGGEIGQKCDLITADGGFENLNENLQEQEAFRLIISEIINAIKLQKKGGNFVCKMFETFTNTSMKIISMLSALYEDIYFIKPLTSRISNSEKYAVCLKFKYSDNDKELKMILSKLEDIHKIMHENKSLFVVGLFSEYRIPKDFVTCVTSMNILFSNLQLKNINKSVSFMRKEIYSGDEYYDSRDDQIKATKFWLDLYYPKDKQYSYTDYKKMINAILDITEKRYIATKKMINV
ncbi:FtsJ-like methyltransferase [Bodo saltans virus]|uniref:FtsJ-like methyltransferase n=1 Tax=Bodo saltans virus TaxID=2024608 RepID=A0A2H4UW75_9VIRU|nr:FtsJ-like methyltransferase [Bodo saltans virus]ATZ80939.1 FtsJ-like methyltransferase [Bodo saltans virus]